MSKLVYCFSNDYMVLRPDSAGLIELLHLLFSPNIGRNRAVCCFTGKKECSFARRLAIFFHLLLQILLHWLMGPLAALGTAVEFAINLADNILHGKLEHPQKSSPTYRSITGLLDRRVDLDRSIKPTDKEYNSVLCIRASKLAYENESFIRNVVTSHWQMEFKGFFNCRNEFQSTCTAQAFVLCDKAVDADLVLVAYRGTRPFDVARWCADLDPSWYEIPRLGAVPAALTHALGAQPVIGLPKWLEDHAAVYAYYTIRDSVKKLLGANDKARLLVTGHGSGGVLALMFESILRYHNETLMLERLAGVYPLGLPRPGSAIGHNFNETYTSKGLETSSWMLSFVISWINSVWKLRHGVYMAYQSVVSNFPGRWKLMLMPVLALVLHVLPFHWMRDYVVRGVALRGRYLPKFARGMAYAIQGKETSSWMLSFIISWINSVWKLRHGVYMRYQSVVSNFPWRWKLMLMLMPVLALVLHVLPFRWMRDYMSSVVLH